jgi:hypothetical protein
LKYRPVVFRAGAASSMAAGSPCAYVGTTTYPVKYYYFYISLADERHRFSTSIWRMLTLLGSYRYRGNTWFDEGSTVFRSRR